MKDDDLDVFRDIVRRTNTLEECIVEIKKVKVSVDVSTYFYGLYGAGRDNTIEDSVVLFRDDVLKSEGVLFNGQTSDVIQHLKSIITEHMITVESLMEICRLSGKLADKGIDTERLLKDKLSEPMNKDREFLKELSWIYTKSISQMLQRDCHRRQRNEHV